MKTIFLFALSVSSAFAHDHINLERGIPVQLEDAYPTAYQNREIQGFARYERNDRDQNRYEVTPVIEYGFIRNGELELEVPYRTGAGPDRGSGDIEVAALYNFNYEGLVLPAVSVSGTAIAPTGQMSRGVDTIWSLLLTKTLSRSTFFHRLHLNARWHINARPSATERANRYEFALGYQFRLDQNNQLILSGLRKEEVEQGKESNLIELGLRHQWNPLWVFAAGVGVGVGTNSPEVVGTVGFQHALNLFYSSP